MVSSGRLILVVTILAGSIISAFADTTDVRPRDGNTTTGITDTIALREPASLDSANARTAVKDSIDYDAASMEYDIKNKIVLLTGEGVVRYKSMTLFADTIHYVIDQNMLIASGRPMLVDRGDTVVGESMVYNLQTRRGKVKKASARTAGAHYDGEQMVKSDSSVYYIHEGDYTTCAVTDHPHYLFYGKNIKVMPGDKAVTRPLVLNIGDAPVAALPYFILPLDRDRKSGFLRWRWGGNPGQGGYLDNVGYYWVPNDYMDFTFASKISEFQDYVFNLSGRYRVKYWLSGNVSGRYTLSTNYDTLSNRWAIDYNHYQNLLPDETFKLSGRGHVASGKSFYRTFSEDTSELLNQEVSANLSLSKDFPSLRASTNLTWDRKHNFVSNIVSQDFPSFSFSLPTRPLIPSPSHSATAYRSSEDESKWYNDIMYSYRMKSRRLLKYTTPEADEYLDVEHTGVEHSANLSFNRKLFKYFNVSPRFSAGHSLFDARIRPDSRTVHDTVDVFSTSDTLRPGRVPVARERDENGFEYVYFEGLKDTSWIENDTIQEWSSVPPYWSTGINLSTNIYGLFPIRLFNFAGLRHTLSPSISYTFRPERELDWEYPSVVGYTGDQYRSQSIGLRIGNLFQGKTIQPALNEEGKPIENKFTILNADLSASYDFESEDRKWSDISLSAHTNYKMFNVS
ncbi:MAG: hypothetical protein GF344_10435, partial [Chitinivibrionales bacterium]|nr:hypothetical protein [Chitinivibrionales bacterium]MBD3357242.1 hypothetical protein [Chitinivibrionales bacterium]